MSTVKTLAEISPEWLHIPALLATTTNESPAPQIFYRLAKEFGLEPKLVTLGSSVLNLFQHSSDTLDGICFHDRTRAKAHIHKIWSVEKTAVWAFGLLFHAHEYIVAHAPNAELGAKLIQLFDKLVMIRLQGQDAELAIRGARAATTHKEVAKLKTGYPSITFPVALLTLLKMGDMRAAHQILKNEALLELGYWFHTEAELKDHLDPTKPANGLALDHKWTHCVELLFNKLEPGEFGFPGKDVLLYRLLNQNDVFYDYIMEREKFIKGMETEVKASKKEEIEKLPLSAQLLKTAKAICTDYFRTKHQFDGFGVRVPRDSPRHENFAEIIRKVNEFVEGFPASHAVKQFTTYGWLDYNYAPMPLDWLNQAFHYIAEVDTLVKIHKFNIFHCVIGELLQEVDNYRLIAEFDYIFELLCAGKTLPAKINWHNPHGDVETKLDDYLTRLIPIMNDLQKRLPGCRAFDHTRVWLQGLADLRMMLDTACDRYTLEEYCKVRSNASPMTIFFGFACAYRQKPLELDDERVKALRTAAWIQDDIVEYAAAVIGSKRKRDPKPVGPNIVDAYRDRFHKGDSVLDAIKRLNDEEFALAEGVIMKTAGTECEFIVDLYQGRAYCTYLSRYKPFISKGTGTAVLVTH